MLHKAKLMAGCLMVASPLLTSSVLAQTSGASAGSERGFYVGAGIGYGKAADACDFSGTGFSGSCEDSDNSWNIYAGYQFLPNIAIEGGYVDLGEVNARGAVGAVAVSVSAEATALEILGVGSLPLSSNFSIYGKAGLTRWDVDARATGPAGTFRVSDTGTDFTVGAGAQYSFTPNLAVRAEVQHYHDVGGSDVNLWRATMRYKF